jgi:hypothetical protein
MGNNLKMKNHDTANKMNESLNPSAPVSYGTLPLVGTALLGLAAAVPSAEAQVVATTVTSGGTISAGQSLYFDLGESGGPGSWSTSNFGGADFRLSFYNGFIGPNSAKPMIYNVSGGAVAQDPPYWVKRLALNDSVGSSLTWNTGALYFNYHSSASSPWSAGQRGYVGLRLGSGATTEYAWADVQYTAGQQLTLFSFAVQTSPNTAIPAGSTVPEPKQTALVMALLAGSVGLYHRRQRAARA